MDRNGWIFLITFWTLLILVTTWSYRVLLSEPHIPMGPLEEEEHPSEHEHEHDKQS